MGRIMSLPLGIFLDSATAGGLEAIRRRLHNSVVESHGAIAEGFSCAVFRLEVNVVQDNVAAWYSVTACKFHCVRSS